MEPLDHGCRKRSVFNHRRQPGQDRLVKSVGRLRVLLGQVLLLGAALAGLVEKLDRGGDG